MSHLNEYTIDAYSQPLVSLDEALEEMEQRSEKEDMSNQPNPTQCFMSGFNDDYVPSYLR